MQRDWSGKQLQNQKYTDHVLKFSFLLFDHVSSFFITSLAQTFSMMRAIVMTLESDESEERNVTRRTVAESEINTGNGIATSVIKKLAFLVPMSSSSFLRHLSGQESKNVYSGNRDARTVFWSEDKDQQRCLSSSQIILVSTPPVDFTAPFPCIFFFLLLPCLLLCCLPSGGLSETAMKNEIVATCVDSREPL